MLLGNVREKEIVSIFILIRGLLGDKSIHVARCSRTIFCIKVIGRLSWGNAKNELASKMHVLGQIGVFRVYHLH